MPRTIEEAVERLISELPLKDKTEIAKMGEKELIELHLSSLGLYIRTKYGLLSGNKDLLNDCRFYTGKKNLHAKSASYVIIKELWERLRETHLLRIVK